MASNNARSANLFWSAIRFNFSFAVLLAFATVGRADETVSFNKDIRPVLSENCYNCHGPDVNHRKADRRLDTLDGMLADHDGVKAIVPGSLTNSEVWRRVSTEDEDDLMPPTKSGKALTAAQKEKLRAWILAGAKYEAHWSFVAPVRPAVSAGVNAIDYFVEKTLAANALSFSPPSAKGELLRRVTLNLTGLPPTLAELDAFENDSSADAYERAVDRLLASPRYGERMAMDWLDAARYADSNGYQGDAYRMNWPWRDWVIRAFNDNMPFDRFTIEQLAGDLLPNPTTNQLIATAFNRNHALNAEGGAIAEENRAKNVFDRVETTSGVWLGLTMQCCQCHDHKFDPLLQKDYFSMFAFFNQISEPGGVNKRFGRKAYSDGYDKLYAVESPVLALGTPEKNARLETARAEKNSAEAAIDAKRSEYEQPFVTWILEMRTNTDLVTERVKDDGIARNVTVAPLDNFKDDKTRNLLRTYLNSQPQWKPLLEAATARQDDEDNAQIEIPLVMVMRDDKPRETHILLRGNYETPGEKVLPGVPSFLPPLPTGVPTNRLALAEWLVSPEQPLMSRVVVNRLWQLCFGRGLVKTPDDFGAQGALPSHPELLDWLAVEFRESGWDVKHILKLIVTSRTYRQSANLTPALLAADPENALLTRGPRFRVDSRFLRDQALALSGLLVEKIGGVPVMPYQPPGIWEDISFGKNRYFQGHGEDLYRRSLYTFWRRSSVPANFFDTTTRQVCAVKPQRTDTPLHALTTLNDITYGEAARVWAEKITALPDDTAKLKTIFRAATARTAEPRELASLEATLTKARAHFAENKADAEKLVAIGETPRVAKLNPTEQAAWTTVCLLVLNLDEALTE